MKVIYDFFVFDAVMKFGKSEFEFRRALRTLIQTAELTGNERRRTSDFFEETHEVEVGGV